MEFRIIPEKDYERLYEYMRRDFPSPGELAPFHAIKRNLDNGRYEGFYLYADVGEVGYMLTMSSETTGLVFINYFGVHPELRSKGYGRAALNTVVAKYSDRCIVIEVSDPAAAPEDSEKRELAFKRLKFYENAGFTVAPTVRCKIYGVDMLIMATNLNLYKDFSAREAMLTLYNYGGSGNPNINVVDA
jgi:GNAT superfamily N-acetyltransferase